MAWKLRTTCQQCDRKLSKKDRALGTVCSACVGGNKGRVWGRDEDEAHGGEEEAA